MGYIIAILIFAIGIRLWYLEATMKKSLFEQQETNKKLERMIELMEKD